MATKPRTIDEYLAGLSPENRAALQKVRRAVHAAAPDAEECISYGMPAFRLNGKLIAGFKAVANHCSFHPMSGDTVATLKADVAGYETSKGTIKFSARAGLPATLVRKLVQAENFGGMKLPIRRGPRRASRWYGVVAPGTTQ